MRKSCYYIFFFAFGMMLFAFRSEAQQLKLGNNPTQINPASVLELQSYNQGLRLTRADTNAVNEIIAGLSPALQDSTNGMVIFQISDSSIYYRTGGYWRKLAITDSVGIQSLNGDKSRIQSVKLVTGANNYATPTLVDSTNGNHYLFLPFASSAYTGIVNTGGQTFGGPKTFANTLTLGQDLIANGSSGIDGQVLRSGGAGISPRWENMLLDSLYNVRITNPQNGDILLYNNVSNNWANTAGNGTFWQLNGNSGTDSTKNFLGTTDQRPLIFKANGSQVGYLGYGGVTGNNNVIFGYGSSITGNSSSSVAIGNGATVSQSTSIAIGKSANVTSPYSIALSYATASANNAIAIGYSSGASGGSSVALGYGASATASSSVALGPNTKSSGMTSVALGLGAQTQTPGSYSIAIGGSANAGNIQSIAIGYKSQASGNNATAIGANVNAWNPNTLLLGDTTGNIKVGIGTSSPSNTLTITAPSNNASGLTLTKLTSASPATTTPGAAILGVDNGGKVIVDSGSNISNNIPASPFTVLRTIGTPFLISGTRNAMVNYTIALTASYGLFSGPGTSEADLQISQYGTSWTTIATISINNAAFLSGSVTQTIILSGFVPKGYYTRINQIISGTGSVTYVAGQEMTLP